MKKTFLIFIILAVVLVVVKLAYTKYCESHEDGCNKENLKREFDGLPQEGVDY